MTHTSGYQACQECEAGRALYYDSDYQQWVCFDCYKAFNEMEVHYNGTVWLGDLPMPHLRGVLMGMAVLSGGDS